MKNVVSILLIGLLFCSACVQSDPVAHISPTTENILETVKKSDPIQRTDISEFVLDGYSILDTTWGDLNLDEFDDLVMILKKDTEESTSDIIENPELRPVLLLCGGSDNDLKLVKRSDHVTLCYDCGGIMGDPYAQTVIKDGYFTLEFYGGSNWRWSRYITFKFNKEESNWFLHKDGGDSHHTSEPEDQIETNVLTTKDFGVVSFEMFNAFSHISNESFGLLSTFKADKNDLYIKYDGFEFFADSIEFWDGDKVLSKVQTDTTSLYLGLGESIENRKIQLSAYNGNKIRVFQSYENSVTLMNEGPHCDLIDWKHYNSKWVELEQKNGFFTTDSYTQQDWNKFESGIDIKELLKAVKEHCGEHWMQLAKDATSVNDYPFGVGMNKIYLKFEVTDVSGKVYNRFLVLEIPMGC